MRVQPEGTSAMYTLYYSPGTASMVVHLALLEIGAPHELKLVDFDRDAQHDPAYLELNPRVVVPTLGVGGIADDAGRAPSRGGADPAAGYTGTRGMAAMGGLSQQHADVDIPPVVLSRRTGCDGTHAGSPRGLAAEDRGCLGPARHTAGATRPVPAWHGVLRRRPAADHADALVAQHASAGHRMARAAAAGRPGARPAELEASVRDRGPARMMRYARPWAARA